VINTEKKWLAVVPWETIVQLNQSLCQNPETPHKPGKGYVETQRLWNESVTRNLSLTDALDVCRRAHALAPFAFFNGNTFAGAIRILLDESLKPLPPVEAQILRSTVAHYVAGVVKVGELHKVFVQIDQALTNGKH
jgi:hypothetical protein